MQCEVNPPSVTKAICDGDIPSLKPPTLLRGKDKKSEKSIALTGSIFFHSCNLSSCVRENQDISMLQNKIPENHQRKLIQIPAMHTTTNFTTILFLCSALITSCNKTTQLTATKSGDNKEVSYAGKESSTRRAFEYGILSYSILDSVKLDQARADLIVKMIEPAWEWNMLLDRDKFINLKTVRMHNAKLKDVYHARENVFTRTVEITEGKFYTQIDLDENRLPDRFNEEDRDQIREMVQVEEYEPGKYSFFGYNCKKVVVNNPGDRENEMMTAYVTDEVPYLSDIFGPVFETLGGGWPVRMEMQIGALLIKIGIRRELSVDDFKNEFNLDLKGFTELSGEDFQKITAFLY